MFRLEKPSKELTCGLRRLTFEGKQLNHGEKRLPPFERGRALPYEVSRWGEWFLNNPGHRFPSGLVLIATERPCLESRSFANLKTVDEMLPCLVWHEMTLLSFSKSNPIGKRRMRRFRRSIQVDGCRSQDLAATVSQTNPNSVRRPQPDRRA